MVHSINIKDIKNTINLVMLYDIEDFYHVCNFCILCYSDDI